MSEIWPTELKKMGMELSQASAAFKLLNRAIITHVGRSLVFTGMDWISSIFHDIDIPPLEFIWMNVFPISI